MYNRYVPRESGYVRVSVEEEPEKPEVRPPSSDEKKYTPVDSTAQEHGGERKKNFIGSGAPEYRGEGSGTSFLGDKSGGLKSLLKALKLEDVDSGDLLLLLIILLLLTDGDELDLVITLGLMLLLGLGDKKSPDSGLSGLLRSL